MNLSKLILAILVSILSFFFFSCAAGTVRSTGDDKKDNRQEDDGSINDASGDTDTDSDTDTDNDTDIDTDTDMDTDTDNDTDTDADSDADADGDTDVDADADADPCTACANATSGLTGDFESGGSGFAHGVWGSNCASWSFDDWEHGTPSSGQPACHGGSNCWGTELTDNIVQCGHGYLQTPTLDLSACSGAADSMTLTYWHNYEFMATDDWTGETKDGLVVQFSNNNGGSWTDVAPAGGYPGTIFNREGNCCGTPLPGHGKDGFTGASTDWEQVEFDIPDSYWTNQFRIRWGYSSGHSHNSSSEARSYNKKGYFIDDISISVECTP